MFLFRLDMLDTRPRIGETKFIEKKEGGPFFTRAVYSLLPYPSVQGKFGYLSLEFIFEKKGSYA